MAEVERLVVAIQQKSAIIDRKVKPTKLIRDSFWKFEGEEWNITYSNTCNSTCGTHCTWKKRGKYVNELAKETG